MIPAATNQTTAPPPRPHPHRLLRDMSAERRSRLLATATGRLQEMEQLLATYRAMLRRAAGDVDGRLREGLRAAGCAVVPATDEMPLTDAQARALAANPETWIA